MASLLEVYHYVNHELAHKKTLNWFWTGSYVPLFIVSVCYLLFIKKLGPEMMKNRQPFQLKTVLAVYNIFQVLACIWMIHQIYYAGFHDGSLTIKCQNIEEHGDKLILYMGIACYGLYLKIIDLLDTVFFVLRKKDSQATFLHVYHHLSMCWMLFLGIKYGVVGSMFAVPSSINFAVHIIMYTYYFLAGLGPDVQKKIIFLKPFITQMQMIQFVLIGLHLSQLFLPMCRHAGMRKMGYVVIFQTIVYFYLFYDFYKKAYRKQVKQKKSK